MLEYRRMGESDVARVPATLRESAELFAGSPIARRTSETTWARLV